MEDRQTETFTGRPGGSVQALLERSPRAILVLRGERVLFANQALAKLLGYKKSSDLAPLGSKHLFSSPARRWLAAQCKKLLSAGQAPGSGRVTLCRRRGPRISLHCDLSLIEWEGAPAAQAVLRPLPAKDATPPPEEPGGGFRTLVESAPQGILVFGKQGILYANKALAGIFGYPDAAPLLSRPLTVLLARGEKKKLETSAGVLEVGGVRRDGSQFRLTATPAKMEWEGASATCLTVSEAPVLGRSEAELRDTRSLLEAIIEHLPVGLAVVDKNLKVVIHNRLALKMHKFPKRFGKAGVSFEEITRFNVARGEYGPGNRERQVRERVELARKFLPHHFTRERPDGTALEVRGNPLPGGGFISVTADVTAQKKAEEQLRAGRRLLQTVIDTIPHSVYATDTKHRFFMVNQAMAARYGLSAEDFTGRVVGKIEAFTKPDLKAFFRTSRQALETGERVEVPEFSAMLPSGEQRTRRTIKVPLRDEQGSVIGVVGLSEDITERKRAEEQLRESRGMLQTVFDTVPQALYMKDRESRYLMVNQALAALHGLTPADFLGATAEELGIRTPEEREEFLQNDRQLFKTGKRTELPEFAVTLPGGEKQWRRGIKLPFRNAAGKVAGYVGVSEDITKRKEAEAALRASEERFRNLVEGSVQGTIVHRKTQILFANPAAAAIFGYGSAEKLHALGDLKKIIPAEEIARYQKELTALEGSTPLRMEMRGRRTDGKTVHLETATQRVNWEGRRALQSVFHDVSERKQAEEELLESRERFSGILDHALDAIISVDEKRKIILFNKGAERIFGYAAKEVQGRPLGMLFPKGLKNFHARLAKEFGHSQSPSKSLSEDREIFGLRKDGKRFPAEASFSKMELRGSTIYTVMLRDVTARKEAQEALRASERLLQTVFDMLPHSIAVQDKESRFVMVNQALTNIYGLKAKDFLGSHVLDLPKIPPGHREQFFKGDRKVLRSGQVIELPEVRITLPDGRERIRHILKFPLRNEEGRITGLVSVSEDITERKLAEAALRESEERFRNLIEGSIQGVIIHQEGKIVFANQAFCKIHGYGSTEEILGRDALTFVAPRDYERMKRNRAARLRGESVPTHYVRTGQRKDGTEIWLENIAQNVTWRGRPAYQVSIIEITERRKAEEALRASQRLFQTVFELLPIGVSVKNEQLKYVMVNEAFTKIFGVDAERITGSSFREFGLGTIEDNSQVEEMDRRIVAGKKREHLPEVQLTFPNGEVRWRRLTKAPLPGEDGKVSGVISVIEDITEQREAREALNASRRLLQTVFDTLPHWIFVKDRQSRYIMTNNALADSFGKGLHEMPGFNISEAGIGTSEEQDLYLDTDRQVFEKGERVEVPEISITMPDGSRRVRMLTKLPLRDEAEKIVGLVGFSQDITERKKAEEDLRASQRLLQTVFDTLPVSVSVKDRDRRYILTNRAFTLQSGVAAQELVGKRFAEMALGTPEEVTVGEATDRLVLERGEMVDRPEDSLTFPDGRVVWRHTRKAPIYDDEGEIVGLVSVREDITERKRAEQALFQAQKLESLGVLAGGVAHDFNNILLSIIGNAGLALMNLPEGVPGHHEITQIEVAGQRAAELCRQMLAYAGQAQLVVENIDLNALVGDMAHLVQVSISKQCVLSYQFAKTPPITAGDPGQIQQVAMNLVINASEAIGDKQGVISISTGMANADQAYLDATLKGEGVEPGEFVFLEVSDTGEGMDPETVAKIFDPFFTTKFTGRGLGLAAVLGIVRGHKGALKVDSEPGQGTTFRLLLPPARAGKITPPPEEEQPEWRGQGTVLVVDDEPAILQVTGKMLENIGFSVLSAGNGKEGVELFQAHAGEISAVLLDLTMPIMGGEETLEKIFAIRTDVPVVVMSGYHEQDISDRFEGRNAPQFLQKPFKPSALREKLQGMLG